MSSTTKAGQRLLSFTFIVYYHGHVSKSAVCPLPYAKEIGVRYPLRTATEPFVEFFRAELVFLCAIALYGKRGAYAAHPGALLYVLTLGQSADQASPERVSGACGVDHLPWLACRDVYLAIFRAVL
jgi:hypothetical protein